MLDQLHKQIGDAFGAKFVPLLVKSDAASLTKSVAILEKQSLEHVIVVLDIVVRWMTVRMSEKNTTVLTKVLEWLHVLVVQLKENEYRMEGFEALALLPHLIGKLGESREEVRNVVNEILLNLEFVYSDKRIFEQILIGTKCKNSRQRTECLKHLAEMIGRSGVDVCGPPKQQSLKDIAAHISDKDQGVRSSAMNCLVEVHKFKGDELFNPKLIGRLGEKEESYLRERIRRAATEQPTQPEPKADKRKSITIATGAAAQKLKIKRNLPEVPGIAEAEEEEMAPGRFRLEEPPPASCQIARLEILATDVDDILADFAMPVLNHSEAAKNTAKCLAELNCKIRSYSAMTDEMMTHILTLLTHIEIEKVNTGLTMLNSLLNSDPPLDIDTHVSNTVIALSKLLTGKIFDWLSTGEVQPDGIRMLKTISLVIFQLIKQPYANSITAKNVEELFSSKLRLLNNPDLKVQFIIEQGGRL